MSSTKVTLRHHTPKADRVPPVVATFPHGFPPAECFAEAARPDKRQRGSLGPLRFAYLQNADAGKSNQRVVLAGNDKMAYRGTNFGRFATSKSLSKYMVGVYNKDTKHVDLYDVEQVFALQQQGLGDNSAGPKDSIDGNVTDMDRRKLLIQTFGSRKKQNLQKSREAGMVDAGNVTSGTAVSRLLNKTAAAAGAGAGAGAGATDAVADAQAATRKSLLPPVNLEATAVQDAYPVDGLVTRDEQMALTDTVKELIGLAKKPSELATMRESQTYCEYVLQRLEHLPKNKKEMRATLRLLVYFSHLLTLFEAPFILRANRADTAFGGEEESVPHLAGVPAVVQSRLLSTFCERQVGKSGRTSFVRTQLLRDKLLLHMCAVALTIDQFSFNITTLAKDLKMQPKQLAVYFRELGCSYKAGGATKRKRGDEDGEAAAFSGAGGYTVTLKVPLTFPKPKKGKRGR